MKAKLSYIILGIALFFAAPLSAQIKSVDVEGRGATQNEAIQEALVQAVGRVNGVQIDSQKEITSDFETTMDDVATEIRASSSVSENIKTATKGYISYYDLLSSSSDDGEVVVKIRAYGMVYDPTNPNPGSRPYVVIFPFTSKGAILNAEGLNREVLSDEIAKNLSQKLGEVGYFTIIEGADLDPKIRKELNYSTATGVDPDMQAKIGKIVSAAQTVAPLPSSNVSPILQSSATRAAALHTPSSPSGSVQRPTAKQLPT